MKRKLQHLLCLQLLFFLSITAYALPTIDKVEATDSKCKSDGQIVVTVSGTTGTVKYGLDYYDNGVVSPYIQLPQASNVFTGLPPRTYIVRVYDDVTGSNSPVSQEVVVGGSYSSMSFATVPAAGMDNFALCDDNGVLTFQVKGGTLPYTYKVTNTTSGKVYTQTITSAYTYYSFKNLDAGKYQIEVSDGCEVLTAPSLITVTSTGGYYKNGIQSFDASLTTRNHTTSGTDCSTLNVIWYNYSSVKLNGAYMQNGYYSNFQYIIEYPAGSGTYTALSGVNSSTVNIRITNFDPSVSLKYKIGVKSKCQSDIVWDPQIYTVPETTVRVSMGSYYGYTYDGFCNVESGSLYFYTSVTGLNNPCAVKYPLTLTYQNTSNNTITTETWTKDNGTYFYPTITMLPNVPYNIKITDSSGAVLYSTNNYSISTQTPYAYVRVDEINQSFIKDCDNYDQFALNYYLNTSASSGAKYKNIVGGHMKFEITSGPTSKAPKTVEVTTTNSTYFPLWSDLEYGKYDIKISYYNAGVDPDKATPCKVLTSTINMPKAVYGFQLEKPELVSPVCNVYNIRVKGTYLNSSGASVNNTSAYYMFTAFLMKKGSSTILQTRSGYSYYYVDSDTYKAIFNDVAPGEYTIKVTNYYNQINSSNPNPCFIGEVDVTILPQVAPTIDVLRSGGISCTDGGQTNLTVNIESGGTKPFKYKMKNFYDSDANYTPWQPSNVFNGVSPGKYMVSVLDSCGYETTGQISVFNGSDQFLVIKGEVPGSTGHICKDKPTVLSVLSVGPVISYAWYKDGNLIAGATGPTYTITNADDADKGKYTVKINNGLCELESSVYIIAVDPIPATPIIVATGCGTASTTLTISNHVSGQTYTWYRDGVVISGASSDTYTTNQQGAYSAMVNEVSGKCSSHLSDIVTISSSLLYWKDNAANSNWNDASNWITANGSAVTVPPGTCTEVHIGKSSNYPNLDISVSLTNVYGTPTCDRIIFHYGGEIYAPHNLKYNQAIVQYNFGYYKGNYNNSLSNVEDTYPGHTIASKPLIARNSWQLISNPLKKMVSGDFALAGYPMTWQSNIKVLRPTLPSGSNLPLTEVNFTSPVNTNDIELSKNNHALAVKVSGYQSGVLGRADHKYLENLKGIIAYPYFEDATIMSNRPGTTYSNVRKESTLYYFNVNTLQMIYNPVGSIKRGAESYRFVFESDATNRVDTIKLVSPGSPYYKKPGYTMTITPSSSGYILIGNPFMTSISFEDLSLVNDGKFEVDGFYRFDSSTNTWVFNNSQSIISPLEAVLVRVDPTTPNYLFFPMTLADYSSTRSLPSQSSDMIVELISPESSSNSSAELSTRSGNVEKLINSEGGSSAEIYFVDNKTSDFNLIQSYDGSSTVHLGVRSSNVSEPLKLQFHNFMDAPNGTTPVLVDKLFDMRLDLTQQEEYTFYQQTLTSSSQYADNDRFEIRFVEDASSIVLSDIVIRYKDQLSVISKDVLSTITIYDIQGRQVANFDHIDNTVFYQNISLPQGIYIVKATTVNGLSKSDKIAVM